MCSGGAHVINIVLYEPEIPQNTGNIMRTCMAFACRLHLIGPLGFYMDEKHLRRAGMDYRDQIEYKVYDNWDHFLSENKGPFFYTTRYAKKDPSQFDLASDEDIYLVFGKESTGIPKEILLKDLDHCMRIPMVKDARSLNLSNCVSIVVYETIRQKGFEGLSRTEYLKGEDFLETYHINGQ